MSLFLATSHPSSSSRCGPTRHGSLTEEFAHTFSNETAAVFKGEVSRINQVQLRFWDVSLVGPSSLDCEERVVFSPEDQHLRLSTSKVLMPAIIESDIRLIVVQKIELNGRVPRTIEEELIQGVGIRADSVRICNTVCVLNNGRFLRQQIAHWLLCLGIAIGPERLHRVECAANAFLVRIPVLNNNSWNSIWMC